MVTTTIAATFTRRKRSALDAIHGTTRTDYRELIRVDRDYVYESYDEFLTYINSLKVRPQQFSCVRDDEFPERITKPHLLYWLPVGGGVWHKQSARHGDV